MQLSVYLCLLAWQVRAWYFCSQYCDFDTSISICNNSHDNYAIKVLVSALFGLQVGIPVLGVVENMSGLSQQLQKFTFFSPGPDGTQQDVTQQVLQHLPAELQVSDAMCMYQP